MKIYAACYTDCYHEYGPAVFSLHLTREGAEMAIGESKDRSKEYHEEMLKYVDWAERDWNSYSGGGHEQWCITEMEVKE